MFLSSRNKAVSIKRVEGWWLTQNHGCHRVIHQPLKRLIVRFPEAQMVLKHVFMWPWIFSCSFSCVSRSAAIGTAVQVLLCESFGLIDYMSVPVTVMYLQSSTHTKGWLNQVWHILLHIGLVFMVKCIIFLFYLCTFYYIAFRL